MEIGINRSRIKTLVEFWHEQYMYIVQTLYMYIEKYYVQSFHWHYRTFLESFLESKKKLFKNKSVWVLEN